MAAGAGGGKGSKLATWILIATFITELVW